MPLITSGLRGIVAATLAVTFCLAAAADDHFRSDRGEIFSPSMEKAMAYSVYTPPGWQEGEALPLVVLLHGGGGSHESFDKYGVGEYLDSEVLAGRAPRAVIVNPDGELGFWENWNDGSRMYRDWVMKDLLPVVQERYGTMSCPEHCHVMGVSMGAHGALRFAYYEGDHFSTVTVISGMIMKREEVVPTLRRSLIGWFIPFERIWGDIEDPSSGPRDLDPYVAWAENDKVRSHRLFLSWGSEDKKRIRVTSERFHHHLDRNDLPHYWHVYDGRHKWKDWKRVIAEALRIQIDGAPAFAALSAPTREP